MVVINLRLMLFILLSSISGFVWNDLMDVEEDKLKQKVRNPIATGRISPVLAYLLWGILTICSVILLFGFNQTVSLLGAVVLTVWCVYSWGPRLKNRPPLDLFAHGSWAMLYVLMGFGLCQPLTIRVVLIGTMVFCFGVVANLLQEIRDIAADGRTTVRELGSKRGATLTILLMLVSACCYILIVLEGFLPSICVAFVPFIYFVLKPLYDFRDASTVIAQLRFRGFLIGGGMVIAYLVLTGGRVVMLV